MKEQKDKMVENLIANDLMKELGIDEERMLSRIEFTEKEVKPFYKQIKFLIPTLSCALLIIMALVSLLSISVYKNVNESVYNDNDIVYIALEEFEEEIEGFAYLERVVLYQVDKEIIISIYYSEYENQYYTICYQNGRNYNSFTVILNQNNLHISNKIAKIGIDIKQSNELIVYKNSEEIFKTNFKI